MDEVVEMLRLFWDKGIKKVSPGALGTTLQGCPMTDEGAELLTELLPFATWDGTWIVLDEEPTP